MKTITAYVKNKDTCIIIHLIHLQFSCILNFSTLGGSNGLGHFLTILRSLIKRRPLYTDIEKKYVEFFFPINRL